MRKIFIPLAAVMVIMMISCEKEEITPSSPDIKENLRECRTCEGSWDITVITP
jgi:hypothetical protein